MHKLIILFLIYSSSLYSQNIDYNTKKGFAANGYDVVAYFNHQVKEGKSEFTIKFDGIPYKFSNKENLLKFKNNPEKYSPQYGGYCAYAIAVKSSKVSIDPDTYLIRDDKLYLFYNAWGTNTLELWQKEDMTALEKKADDNWNKIKHKK